MAYEAAHLGYQGNLGFWGNDASGTPKNNWWNQDMSDSGQALYSDPQTGIETGTMPDELLAQYDAAKGEARKARGGFLQQLTGGIKDIAGAVGGGVDSVLENVIGKTATNLVEGAAKDTAQAVWWPVDKLATGAYWLYSNAISQPLSTALLTSADAELSGNYSKLNPFSDESTWGKNYDQAEHISPAQAFMNYENTAEASGQGTALSGVLGGGADKTSAAEKEAIKRNTNRFMYDTDYWRRKQGWTYTVGTGAMDFALSMGADPSYAAVKGVSSGVKAARSTALITPATAAAAAAEKSQRGLGGVGQAVGIAVGNQFARTPEEASRGKKINEFFDWADGKTAAEISKHPIWGKGRRINPEANKLSEHLANTSREDMPLFLRFAGGDNSAAAIMAQKGQDNLIRIGKLQENRALVDSTKLDLDAAQHYLAGEAATTRGTSALPSGLHGLSTAGPTGQADILRANEWKSAQLDLINKQIAALQTKGDYYSSILGNIGKGVDDFSPTENNVFGTVSNLYRQGPLALRSSEATAEKNIAKMTGARGAKVATESQLAKGGRFEGRLQTDSGFVARTIRNGFYSPNIKLVNSFGDRLPSTFIDHNADDAFDRLSDMLRRVPKLDPEVRLGMINSYTNAGDKVSRSKELDKIHTAVIQHMAGQHNLDLETARIIDGVTKNGISSTIAKLTNQAPNDQIFSAAKVGEGESAVRADMVDDHGSWIISPRAKTQLSVGQPLLDVKMLDRLLKRNSGYLGSIRTAGGKVTDPATAIGDLLNSLWKASTLLRPGYTLRSMSDEQAASAVKFGIMSTIIGAGKGGANWALNRTQQLAAQAGAASYVSATGTGRGTIKILDEAAREAAVKNPELKISRVKVHKAWPVVEGRLTQEREGIAEMEALIKREKAHKTPDQSIIDDANARIVDHQNTIGEFSDYAHALLREATDATGRRLGEGTIEHRGVTIPEAFSREWEHPIPRDQVTSSHAMETIFARSESVEMNRLIKTGSWTTIAPDATNPVAQKLHMESWLNGLNKQYRQDPLFQRVANDPTLKEAKAWLASSDGKYHRSILGPAGRDAEELLNAVKSTLDHYLPPATGLQAKMAKGEEILASDLKAAIHPEAFPVVHGEEFTSLTRHGQIQSGYHAIDKLIETGFRKLGSVPNDVMARQPIYLRAQEARMRQLMDQELSYRKAAGKDDKLDPNTMNNLLQKSDRLARKDISQVVYDPTRTTATEALRFVAPFMAAHVDGLSRWAGLLAEKPQMATVAAKIYNAPVAANMVTDQSGNVVGEDGYADVIDPTTGKVVDHKFVPIEDRTLHLRMPTDTKNAKKMGGAGVAIPVSSINTLLPGDPWFNPGGGPLVQIIGTEVAKQVPAVGDFLQWAKIMPYGPSKGIIDAMTPKYMKSAWDAYTAGDVGNDKYQQAYLAEYQRQMADYHNGGEAPDMKKVASNAKKFMYLDALTSWAMPVSVKTTPLTGTPYQFFLDQYKAMQQVDPKNAKTNFFNKYGEGYFAFTADLSKSIGVQATLSAQNTAEQFGDLIAQDPDLAPLIVGDTYNQGKFSSSVYRKQMDQYLGGTRMREKISALDAIKENQKDLGWQQYSAMSNMLDGEMIRSGFHSYNQAGAEPLANLKSQMVQMVADGNDAWYEDYGTTSTTKLPLRIKAMEKLVQNKAIMSDPFRNDAKGIAAYLSQRKILQQQLQSRGAKSLSFGLDGTPYGQNADIGMQLRTLQLYLVNSNLEFADVFHRYLESDDLGM
jgi:hypothetical protein